MSLRPSIYRLFVLIPITVALEHIGRVPPSATRYKGIQLVTVYAIIALMFYFVPELVR